MKIQIGTYPGTSVSFVAGTKVFSIAGIPTLLTAKKRFKNFYIIRGTATIGIIAPAIKNYTITANGANYDIDYSSLTAAPALATGDELVIELEIPNHDMEIVNAISVLQTSVNAINNQKTTFINNLTVKYGSIAQYTAAQDGIISSITGATITKIELGIGNVVDLPLTINLGDIIIITTTASAPFTLAITNVVSSKQFTNSQNYGVSSSRYLFGPTYFQKSAYLNDNIILTAISANTAFYNGQFNVEKVNANNISSYSAIAPYLLNRTVDYNNKLYFIDATTISMYNYITKTVTLIYATTVKNIIKVNISSGVYKLYVSSTSGTLMINPDTDVVTIINATSCLSIHYHPDSNHVFACPASGGNLLVINPSDDSIAATIALTSGGANSLSFSTFKTGVTRLFLTNINQLGGYNIYVINTSNNTQESIISINNSYSSGTCYSPITDTLYFFDSSNYIIARYNPNTLARITGDLSPGNGPYSWLLLGNYLYVMCTVASVLKVYDLTNNHAVVRTDTIATGCYKLFYDDIRNLILAFSQSGNIINEINP
jgi:hypothetical protein